MDDDWIETDESNHVDSLLAELGFTDEAPELDEGHTFE